MVLSAPTTYLAEHVLEHYGQLLTPISISLTAVQDKIEGLAYLKPPPDHP